MSMAPREPKNLRLSLSFAGHDKASLLTCSFVRQNLHDVGNNVAGSLDHDGVADADVFAFYFIHVVQRRALDRYTADGHRLQAGDRSQCTGTAHLGLNIENARRCLPRLELVSDGPARRAGDFSQTSL